MSFFSCHFLARFLFFLLVRISFHRSKWWLLASFVAKQSRAVPRIRGQLAQGYLWDIQTGLEHVSSASKTVVRAYYHNLLHAYWQFIFSRLRVWWSPMYPWADTTASGATLINSKLNSLNLVLNWNWNQTEKAATRPLPRCCDGAMMVMWRLGWGSCVAAGSWRHHDTHLDHNTYHHSSLWW